MLTCEITATAGSNGTILPGTVNVNYGSDNTFVIIPNAGYKVSDVLIDGVSVGNKQRHEFTDVNANHTISATFIAENTSPTVNKPVINTNMVPVIWSGDNWEIVSPNDSRWYNYSSSEGKWANVMLRDGMKYIDDSGTSIDASAVALPALIGKVVDSSSPGSLFVWIPRYSYKFSGETVDIKWSVGTTDYTLNNYNLHPAFRFGGYNGGDTSTDSNYESGFVDCTGIWVAKYEARTTNSNIRILENGTKWTGIDIGTILSTAKNMVNSSEYWLSTTYFDTHLIKNTEWGAMAYLQNYATTTARAHEHNIKEIDSNSGNSEYVASYHELVGGTVNYNVRKNGNSFLQLVSKYVDKVKLSAAKDDINNYIEYSNYLGIAVGETSQSGIGNTSLNAESSQIPYGNSPFMIRDSVYGYKSSTGAASSLIGFRPVISAIKIPTSSSYNVSVLQSFAGGTVSGVKTYTSGSTVTLTATPSSGYEFKGWSLIIGGITISNPTSTTLSFTMPSKDVVVFAKFGISDSAINPTQATAKATLTVTTDSVTEVVKKTIGESVTLTATAADGSTFTGWETTGITLANTSTVTFTMPANDVAVVANFS